ncbi:ATP-binding protein [Kineococcus rubinsiae]|uniref:ATP-binding protein n=1 Tax=Kineococcus rubinsiae TaxID=2609562 RepID=UPI00143000DF|nr:ATP-binding protein [Kineococcus rubinsiae]
MPTSGAMDGSPAHHLNLQLVDDLSAGRRARAVLRGCCHEWGVGEAACQVALLLGSELVTNAVVHAAGPVRLCVEIDAQFLRLAVSDASPEQPRRRAAPPEAGGGRGLLLLEELSREWGVRKVPEGKAVWCLIPLSL